MKVFYKDKIGEHTVISSVADAVVDTQKTMKKIAGLITAEMTEADIQLVFNNNLVYAGVGEEAELVADGVAEQIKEKLATTGKNKRLLENGEYIEDHRGEEYWAKRSGKWRKEKVEEIGVPLPADSVLQEFITQEQQQEIYEQQEEERLAALTPEQRDEELERKLLAKLAEIDRLEGSPRQIRENIKLLSEAAGLRTDKMLLHEQEAVEIRAQLDPIQKRLGRK